MKLSRIVLGAVFAVSTVVATTVAALAAPAVATSAVNVRTGPGTGYQVVDQLFAGEQVDVQQCQGSWCYVNHNGPSGWVSSSYLSAYGGGGGGGGGGGAPKPNCSFGISIGSGTPNFQLNCGNQPNPPPPTPQPPPPPPPPPPPANAYACFYSGASYTGSSFCLNQGDYYPSLGGNWDNRISSIQLFNGALVDVCDFPNLSGQCRTYDNSRAQLGNFDDRTSSIQVY